MNLFKVFTAVLHTRHLSSCSGSGVELQSGISC